MLFWAFLVRLSQLWIDAAPWMFVGAVTAAVFRHFVGSEKTQDIFGGDNGWRGVAYGWLWGMLLPVCSLGVIPVVRELNRLGVRGPGLVAFALSAPLFNPLSVLYGLTLSDPVVIISFAFANLMIVSAVSMLLGHRVNSDSSQETAVQGMAPIDYGMKRVVAVLKTGTQGLLGRSGLYMLTGLSVSAIVSALLPHGFMSADMETSNSLAPLVMASVVSGVYSTPLQAMGQVGSMFQHGNSVSAAFNLLIFGAGMNAGLFLCLSEILGRKLVFRFLVITFLVSSGLAYAFGAVLQPSDVVPLGHTHAFDVYTNPWMEEAQVGWYEARGMIEQHYQRNEFGGLTLLAGAIAVGMLFTGLNRNGAVDRWLQVSSTRPASIDARIPDGMLLPLSLAGLVAFSVMGCFLYYPQKEQILADMKIIDTEATVAARTGEWETALKWIAYQEDLARRLEVGVWLRNRHLPEYFRAKGRVYREYLDQLRHEVEDQDRSAASLVAMRTHNAFRRLHRAYQSEP